MRKSPFKVPRSPRGKVRLSAWPADRRAGCSSSPSHLSTSPSWKKIGRDVNVKPTFLINLEENIRDQLPLAHSVQEKLSLFSQSFNEFIVEFQIYKPFLSEVKNTYEDVIDELQHRCHEIPILQSKMEVQADEFRAKLKKQAENFEKEIEDERKKTEAIRARVKEIENQLESSFQHQNELGEERDNAKEELGDVERSRETLYESVKHYQYMCSQKDENNAKLREQNAQEQSRHEKTRVARHAALTEVSDLAGLVSKLPSLVEVHRRQAAFEALKAELEDQKKAYQTLMDQYTHLFEQAERANSRGGPRRFRIDITRSRCSSPSEHDFIEEEERTLTPRPDWNNVRDAGFLDESFLLEETSTSDLVGRLLMDLQYMKDKMAKLPQEHKDLLENMDENELEYFQPNNDASTPKYLRYRGRLRKRRIAKRDTERLLHKIWHKKYSRRDHERMALDEYLYTYFLGEFGIQCMIAEWGYNLLDGLNRYSYDADCELFLKILKKEIPEQVYSDQVDMVRKLLHEFELKDKKVHGGKMTEILDRSHFMEVVRKFFPTKTDRDIKSLEKALSINEARDSIRYNMLFEEDREGNQGAFIECVRDQHMEEMEVFKQDINHGLITASNEFNAVTLKSIREVIQEADPEKPMKQINHIICSGFGVTMIGALTNEMQIEINKFMKRVTRQVILRRSGKKP